MDNNQGSKTSLVGQTFAKLYKITKKIGSGAFGEIYQCANKHTSEEFAIKLEKVDTSHPQVFFEAKLYQYLTGEPSYEKCIPRVHYVGTDNNYNILVLDLLGASLEDLFQKQRKKLSLKTVCMIADQMIQRIEYLHNKGFIHRDIKPDNFLMGLSKRSHKLFMIDFGLSKRFISKEGKHIPYKDGKSLTGTARYASINTHLGIEQSRRDDLEAIGYVLMYFLRGVLPWQNMKGSNKKDKYRAIMEKKMQTPVELLTKGFPRQIASYLNYCKNLRFEDKPDYIYLRGLFKEIIQFNSIEYDHIYDWSNQNDTPKKLKESLTGIPSQEEIKKNDEKHKMLLDQYKQHQSSAFMGPQQSQQQQQSQAQFGFPNTSSQQRQSLLQQTQINLTGTSNLRNTLLSTNKFSSNRKSLDTKEEQHNNSITNQNTNTGEGHNNLPSNDLEENQNNNNIKVNHNTNNLNKLLIQNESLPNPNSILNNNIINNNNVNNLNVLNNNSSPIGLNNRIYTISSTNKHLSIYNHTNNPTLARLQKQNQKLSELLKIQQQQQQKPSTGVPLPRIINHKTYNYYRN